MTEEQVFLTPNGLEKLKERLNYLKSVKRLECSARIGEARSYGDLSENAEYETAREEQAQVEAEIYELEDKLKNAKIIDNKKVNTSSVCVGCNVVLFDMDFNEEVTYKIVGDTESDPANGYISNLSPVGSAILGKKPNEVVSVKTPGGVVSYKILKIKA